MIKKWLLWGSERMQKYLMMVVLVVIVSLGSFRCSALHGVSLDSSMSIDCDQVKINTTCERDEYNPPLFKCAEALQTGNYWHFCKRAAWAQSWPLCVNCQSFTGNSICNPGDCGWAE